ncbi:MAG TPA: peptide chain release factor-like protein [Vitreimonas sp.]|nr:peptide chain release factor-like protein [Vitreimonas sp.]
MFNPYQAQIDDLAQKIADNQALLTDPELKELAELEMTSLQAQKQQLEELAADFEGASTSDDTASVGTLTNCIVEVRQGAGGEEAKIWADDLLRMYMRFIERLGLKFEMIDDGVIKVKGKLTNPELIAQLTAVPAPEADEAPVEPPTPPDVLYPYDIFKFESGVHRVQRVPETEAQGRIHTSTASVAVLPEVPAKAVEIRDEELDWQFMRAGGAGGQNVNKVNSAVRLTHKPSGVVVSARSERSQAQNREIALALLRSQLWEIEEEKRLKDLGEARSAIGRAQRAEKIRTYNYPQNRVTDHRVNESWHNLPTIMDGALEDVVAGVKAKLV